MGLPAGKPADARRGVGQDRTDDPRQAARKRPRRSLPAGLILALSLVVASAGGSETLRIATYNVDLTRRGPGLLLRDILAGDAAVQMLAEVIAHQDPDVLLLTKFDHDHDLVALTAFAEVLARHGADYPHLFALAPNAGRATGLDLGGDGRLGTADDAQGYGAFAGQAGMALLSRLPLAVDEVRDFSDFLWADLPGALLPETVLADTQRLSSNGHWDVPVILPGGGRLRLLAFHAGPPVFGGPGPRNLWRNHDEVMFWVRLLDGALPMPPPQPPFVLLGDSNLDPWDGDGMGEAMRALLNHPDLQDPEPRSDGGRDAADTGHRGDPALDTTHWTQERGPGNLRVDYVLPSVDLSVVGAGVFWPVSGEPAGARVAATRHRLVWVDLALPGALDSP